MKRILLLWMVLMTVVGTHVAQAALELPSIISENMVLQRATNAPLWGWDAPGAKVTVTFRGQDVEATCDANGKWMVRIFTGAAGGPFALSIAGSSRVDLKDVLVGEVWVAGGQSNMWWAVSSSKNAAQETKALDPNLRVWDVNTGPREDGWRAKTPQRTVKAQWQSTNPQTVGGFPATAYFFAVELRKRLNVPVGIVHVAVPGSPIEPFLSPQFAQAHLGETLENIELRRRDYPAAKLRFEQAHKTWEAEKATAEKNKTKVPDEPRAPSNPDEETAPGDFYNGMIAPAAPFAVKGFLWWQGESNSGRPMQYRTLFPALIEEWRDVWKAPDAPFLYVELAGFGTDPDAPARDDSWPNLRDAQRAALALPNVFAITTIDILRGEEGAVWEIHPRNKQLAGHRLFLTAMANVCGEKQQVWSGPTFKSLKRGVVLREFGKVGSRVGSGGITDELVISFDNIGGGLTTFGGGELKGFAVAGADCEWYWATAKIVGQTVVVSSPNVPNPIAVRYAWGNNPLSSNLQNREGLPAAPFRSDNWVLMVKH